MQVGLAASDASGSGVKEVRYTTDGSDPNGSSTLYTAAFAVASTKTVKFRAWDKAGNAEATKTRVVAIDNAAPTVAIKCNNVACPTTWYRGSVKVTLSASDTGGSGVAAIRYTTDGSTPTASSPLYGGPITLSATKTVKYRSFDGAGNASPIGSVQVKIDKTAPTVLFAALKNHAGAGHRADGREGERRTVQGGKGEVLRGRSTAVDRREGVVLVRVGLDQGDEASAHVDGEGGRQGRQQPDPVDRGDRSLGGGGDCGPVGGQVGVRQRGP